FVLRPHSEWRKRLHSRISQQKNVSPSTRTRSGEGLRSFDLLMVREVIEEAQGRALAPEWLEPGRISCLMFFGPQSKEFVGSGCYVASALPGTGQLVQFESVTAEFVGGSGVL